jgi:DNA-binding winged helix-turn-helix (wHTH) protein
MSQRLYRFGNFSVDTGAHALLKDGVRIPIQEQPFQVLLALLENPGQVVTREALRIRLWGTDTFVDFDQSLNSALRRLRLALEDNSRDPLYVETIPRIGFRFLPQVEVETQQKTTPQQSVDDLASIEDELPVSPEVIQASLPVIAAAAPVREVREQRFSALTGTVAVLTFLVGVLLGIAPAHWRAVIHPQGVVAGSRAQDLFPSDPSSARKLAIGYTPGPGGPTTDAAGMSELQGWYHLNQRTDADYAQAQTAFEKTLALRPQSTSALVGLGQSEILLALNGNEPSRRLQNARRLGQQALHVSPHLAAAHTVIGAADALADWNDAEAEQEFLTSLHLEPQDGLTHLWYAVFVLLPRQEYRHAEQEALEAVREEPLSLIAHTDLGWILYSEGKQDAALEQYQFVLSLNPNFIPAQFRLRQARDAGARPPATVFQAAATAPSSRTGSPVLASADGNDTSGCLQAVDAFNTHPEDLNTVRLGVQRHCPQFYFFGQNPELAKLRKDPGFTALLNEAHPPHRLP